MRWLHRQRVRQLSTKSGYGRAAYLAADLLVVGAGIRVLLDLHRDLLGGILIGAAASLVVQVDASAMFVILRYERGLRRALGRMGGTTA